MLGCGWPCVPAGLRPMKALCTFSFFFLLSVVIHMVFIIYLTQCVLTQRTKPFFSPKPDID